MDDDILLAPLDEFTVAHIAQPAVVLPYDAPLWDANGWIEDREQDLVLVAGSDGEILGYVHDFAVERIDDHEVSLESAALPIPADRLVTSTLPLRLLLPLFRVHLSYLVLVQHRLSHLVRFSDLDRYLFRSFLFVVVSALEDVVRETVYASGVSDSDLLARLPENPRRRLERRVKEEAKRDRITYPLDPLRGNPERRALIITQATFRDLVDILLRDPRISLHLPFPSQQEAESFFQNALTLRNELAHSHPLSVLSSPASLASAVDAFLDGRRELLLLARTKSGQL